MTSFRDKLIQQWLTKRYENSFSVVLRIKTSKLFSVISTFEFVVQGLDDKGSEVLKHSRVCQIL